MTKNNITNINGVNNTINNTMNHKNYLPEFEQHLLSLSKSQNTIDSYLSDLKQYFNEFDELNRSNIQKYKNFITGKAATTFNRKMSSLKQFNEFLVLKGVLDEVIVFGQDFIRIQEQLNPTNISEKTVLKFLDRVYKKECLHKTRNIALIYLMTNTGIRREECCNIKLLDINGNKLIIRKGKWNKQRTIILFKKVIEIMNDYLIDRAKHKYADSPYLFVSEKGDKLRKESINGIFDYYCTPTLKVTPHSLRHNFCSTMIEKGVYTPKEVQNQAGHKSILTTDRYTHARIESMEKKVKDFSIG